MSPIFLTLLVIALTLIAFVREWASPDVLALSILCLLVPLGLIDMSDLATVFSNEAPLTIAALFVIGGALERSGAVDHIGRVLKSRLSGNLRWAILAFALVTAFFSAWMNNTAIVAILLPVTLGFARSKDIAASKLLIPLSYASLLGGCCTLIGTSTNLLVNGTLKSMNQPTMSMFELAPIGIPLTLIGVLYLVFFGAKLLPNRSSITGSLEIEQRSSPLFHVLVGETSSLVGKRLFETPIGDRSGGIHVMEIRRDGARVMLPLTAIVIKPNDRYLIATHRRRGGLAKTEEFFREQGLSILSRVEGIVSELVVRDESSLIGRTLADADFRQTYNSVVLAVHRDADNITDKLAGLPLEVGDTLLVITAKNNLDALDATRDFVMTDLAEPDEDPNKHHRPHHVKLAWAVLIAVVLTAALSDTLNRMNPSIPAVPIHYAALVGALFLLWAKVMTPREAYASIDWQVLLMLYGLLGLGIAMQNTGTAEWIANMAVTFGESVIPRDMLPLFMLWLIYLITLCLTEVLSNNATAVMMIPIGITMAVQLGVNHQPYVIAITLAASYAFAMPMGYQTHMMVFGPGGYRFSDFLRVGIPMNLLCWIGACLLIPLIWPL